VFPQYLLTGERVVRALSLAALSCALVLVTACARESPAQSPPKVGDAVALFERACARCHGTDGSGGLPMAAGGGGPRPIDLRTADWQASRSDTEVYAAIRDGRGAMPPFADVLNPDEIAALTTYVRQLGVSSSPTR
jgi:mono/diheme cytochrome c family protein